MFLADSLAPVVGCWVQHGDCCGVVREVKASGRGMQVQVQSGHAAFAWVKSHELRSGYRPGMQVEHFPPGRGEKLGVGDVLAVRALAGCDQALVQFHGSGDTRWLVYQVLKRVHSVEERWRRADVGIEPDHAERFRLRALAHHLEAWEQNTGALGRLDIDPLPHQVHLAHKVLTSGDANWLIADDVGLGKTIEVGLILHGLAARNRARRVLVVCPAGLVRQWQDEMKWKFDQAYEIHGRDFRVHDPAHWRLHEKVIVSLDAAKRPEQLAMLKAAGAWDVIVFDEAHRLGRAEDGTRTERYRLAEAMRALTPSLLLLTATPHQGKTARFTALLELARPDLKRELRTLEANPEVVAEVVIRNRKTKVTDARGEPLFSGHDTHRVAVPPGPATQRFAQALQAYLRHGYDLERRSQGKAKAVGFVMTTYRKLASSSVAAIDHALRLRLARLEAAANEGGTVERAIQAAREEGNPDDLAEREGLFAAKAFFDDETDQVRDLLRLLKNARGEDDKLRLFLEQVAGPVLASGRRLLVFTEYRATQAYLIEALAKLPGVGHVAAINGSMSLDDKIAAVQRFAQGDAKALVSTEAGGEGLNLHRSCHVMVNYDLPWNPSRLVQRIGRLYRYGQTQRVVVFNLHAADSFDNEALSLMLDRVAVMARDLAPVGSEFQGAIEAEILGELLERLDMEEILEGASEMRLSLTEAEIDEALVKAREAARLQDEILAHAEGFDGQASGLGLSRDHLTSFARGMLPRVGAGEPRPALGGRALRFTLPDELVGEFPEFGQRREVTVTADRRLAQEREEVAALDFGGKLLPFLIDAAQARAFDGLYAAAEVPFGWLALYALRWQDQEGRMLEDRLLLIAGDAEARSCAVLNNERTAALLAEPLGSAAPKAREGRALAPQAFAAAAEREARTGVTRNRQPGSLSLVCAAEGAPRAG